MQSHAPALPKVRHQLGKYRIERRLAEGGFAAVYRAFDTMEGRPVALKIPYPHLLNGSTLENVKREVRIMGKIEHPHICPIKNAQMVDGLLVIATPLGEETLEERLGRRLTATTALCFAEQLLEAVAYAHEKHLIHCDIKPDNVILFPGRVLKLTDFGVAKIARRTRTTSSAGTIGYLAPEQALGRPSARSDVFSLGLVLYRMFTGVLPSWPYEWPFPGNDRLRRHFSPRLIEILRRAIQVDDRKRYRDAGQMLSAFRRIKGKALRARAAQRRVQTRKTQPRWRSIRFREFQRGAGRALQAKWRCRGCGGPVSEAMIHCPWCGRERRVHRDDTTFPRRCKRCGRGQKGDWRYCAWCYGPSTGNSGEQRYTDRRYSAKCAKPGCRGPLIPFMRYCPWCRAKTTKRWALPDGRKRCVHCGWGVLPDFWDFCAWCGKAQTRR